MEIAGTIVLILIAAMVVQFAVQVIKTWLPAPVLAVLTPQLQAAVLGIVIAVVYQLDIMAALGFQTQYAQAGWLLTGLIISAGSEPLHELIARIRAGRSDLDGY
jgi:chromate transport protein ChrA